MITILTAADAQNREFRDAFSDYLEHGFHDCAIRPTSGAPLLTLRDLQDVTGAVSGRTIVVFQDAGAKPLPLMQPGEAIAVVDSSDEALLQFVSATGLPAISCGLRSRDTITLSSMDDESAVIDLRRSMPRFDGTVVEPQEIPVRLETPPHKFALMAAAAVMLLTGGLQTPEGKM